MFSSHTLNQCIFNIHDLNFYALYFIQKLINRLLINKKKDYSFLDYTFFFIFPVLVV